jgi:hypothetical protein
MLKKFTVAEGMNYRATLDQDFGAVPLEVYLGLVFKKENGEGKKGNLIDLRTQKLCS